MPIRYCIFCFLGPLRIVNFVIARYLIFRWSIKLMIFNSTQTILLQIIWMEWSRSRKGYVYVCHRVKVEWDKNTESESEFVLYMGPEGKHLNGSPRPCWMVRGGVGLVWRRRWRGGWCPCQDNPPSPPALNSSLQQYVQLYSLVLEISMQAGR